MPIAFWSAKTKRDVPRLGTALEGLGFKVWAINPKPTRHRVQVPNHNPAGFS